MDSALERFIREKQEERTLRENKFPLKSLLFLYLTCSRKPYNCLYLSYFAGFKELVNWLGPIDIPPLTTQKIFKPFYNYEIQEIAVILNCNPAIIQSVFMELYNEYH